MTLKRQLAGWLRRFAPLRWLLALTVRLFVLRHYVGAAGVIFNDAGQILLIEHVFRPHFPWGLPGGWVENGESPAETIRREVEEELRLRIEVKQLLLCELQGGHLPHTTAYGLGLVYYCRLAGSDPLGFNSAAKVYQSHEVLSVEWVDPVAVKYSLAPLEHKAIPLAKQVFDQEQAEKLENRS
jgi:8-oxo-dGTP diphosphatase